MKISQDLCFIFGCFICSAWGYSQWDIELKLEVIDNSESVIEDLSWKHVIFEYSVNSFKEYLEKYPNGRYIHEALEAINWLYEWDEYQNRISSGIGVVELNEKVRSMYRWNDTGYFDIRNSKGEKKEVTIQSDIGSVVTFLNPISAVCIYQCRSMNMLMI